MKPKSPKNIKLHIISRPRSDRALIIVKYPKQRTGFFGFTFSSHKLIEGQWLRGKVYERRSDLSFDGKHILYFAAKHRLLGKHSTFTALSRFPYLKALDYYAKGHTYNGGGLFLSGDKYLLNETYHSEQVYKNSNFKVTRGKLNPTPADEETEGVYFPRLKRDGWKDLGKNKDIHRFSSEYRGWKIIKECHTNYPAKEKGLAIYYDRNELFDSHGKSVLKVTSDWMEFRNDKAYWTELGRIYYAELNSLFKIREIGDLTKYRYKSLKIN